MSMTVRKILIFENDHNSCKNLNIIKTKERIQMFLH